MFHSEVFDVQKKADCVYLQIPSFSETQLVEHGFSTRLGGVSSGIYSSMNLGLKKGDDDALVKANYQIFCDALQINRETLVFTDQIHEDKIAVVGATDRGKGLDRESDLKGVDGLITNEAQVALVTFYADCVPLYFLDPKKKVIGLAHAGWRGTVKKIGAKMVQKMQEVYNCQPEDLLVAIGPSIGQCCFEVSEAVKLEIEKITFEEAEKIAYEETKKIVVEKKLNHDIIEKIVKSHKLGKYKVDLWALNEAILLTAGISKANITKTDLCTMCHPDVLFSHRATNGKRGAMVAMLSLK